MMLSKIANPYYRIIVIIGTVLGTLLIYGELWSLLFNLFYPLSGFPYPWTALFHLTHSHVTLPKEKVLLILTFWMPVLLVIPSVISMKRYRLLRYLFGNAHWASLQEIKKMGFLNNQGLIIGTKGKHLLRAPLNSHALVFAPSRSGKGVSQVMPNALTFPDSLVVIDIKQEIFRDTSGFRKQHGQAVYLFAPSDKEGKTHRWNPLEAINRHPSRIIADCQLVATILLPKNNQQESMWIEEARALFVGMLLWLMESERPFNLGELASLVKGTADFNQCILLLLEEKSSNKKLHPIAHRNLTNFSQKAPKEQSGVKSTLTARLNLWDDPLIHAATAVSDFDIKDLRKKRMTIYLGIPTNQLIRLAPLMNLFIQLFLNAMTEELPSKEEPFNVLMMLDEFCALGAMELLKKGFGFLAGYHIYLMAIIQNVGQFYELYGGRDNCDIFFQNTDYKIAYRQNNRTDQEFISQQLGTQTLKSKSKSYTVNLLGRRQPSYTETLIPGPC